LFDAASVGFAMNIISDALFMEEAAAGLAAALEFGRAQLLDGLDKAGVMRQQFGAGGKGFVKEITLSRVAREQVDQRRPLWLDGCLAHVGMSL
jgi:hypothetical protein